MRRAAPWVALVLALAFPLAMQAEHQTYYLSFASRIFIYALAATSLNLILGYGGMISFGHAAFVGTGAYEGRSEEHTSELQSQSNLVCRLLPEKKKQTSTQLNSSPKQNSHGIF